jgi:hypothetical protein
MNQEELYKLRQESERNFKNPGQLRIFLEELLGKKRILPMVTGYPNFDPKENWRVVNLNPLRATDKLTIELYLLGLKELEKTKTIDSSGRAFYEGVESTHYSNLHSLILQASTRDVKNPHQTFDLYLYFNNIPNHGIGYSAHSIIPSTELEKNTRRFVGPNTHFEEYPKK